jgi:hypothetical protein
MKMIEIKTKLACDRYLKSGTLVYIKVDAQAWTNWESGFFLVREYSSLHNRIYGKNITMKNVSRFLNREIGFHTPGSSSKIFSDRFFVFVEENS